jgi:oligoendopeptidase F
MLSIRKEIAKNADMEDYVAYQYKNYKRLSYDRDDTEKFRKSILKYVVPATTKIIEHRKKLMGIDNFRPWDLKADPQGEEPPVIYETIDELKEMTADVLSKVDEQFGEAFRLMDKRGYLDIENRPGKAPGAYMNEFSEERIPLIFANSVGTSRDFDTLIHEGGHAIHGFSKRHLLYPARRVPIEFAEVASMSLELLARPHWHIVYNEEDRERIGIKQLEDTLLFLPFMAMIDEFQNWVYTKKDGEKSDKRAEYWCKLETKYRPQIDYKGLEDEQKIGWQYDHVFTAPLYYVEYGIAQVGALQVYIRSINNYDRAVEDYKKALSLGNIVSLPELFSEAGVKFVMNSPEVLKDVVDLVMKKIGLDE